MIKSGWSRGIKHVRFAGGLAIFTPQTAAAADGTSLDINARS
jgi:hypothetical protein